MTTPIYLAPLDNGHIPHKYELLIRSQRCDSCGSVHEFSEIHGVTLLRGRMGQGLCDNKRPADHMTQIQYNLPIEIKRRNTTVPFCHACYRPQMLQHLPNIPRPSITTPRDVVNHPLVRKTDHGPTFPWVDKRGNVHTVPAEDLTTTSKTVVRSKTKKSPQRKYTIDDL